MNRHVFIILFLFVSLCSCSRYYYVADTQNVPMFREKKEYRISGAFGIGDESKSIELQSAYALTDKIGITGSIIHAWGGDVQDRNFGRGTCIDAGAGLFRPVSSSGIFEFYGGLGGCIQDHEYSGLIYNPGTGSLYSEYHGSSHLAFFKLFIQPSFGLTYNLLDIIVSTRISNISFMVIENNIFGDPDDYNALNLLSTKGQLLAEPAVTLRGGGHNFKVQAQISYTWHINEGDMIIGEKTHFSAGMFFIFPVKTDQ